MASSLEVPDSFFLFLFLLTSSLSLFSHVEACEKDNDCPEAYACVRAKKFCAKIPCSDDQNTNFRDSTGEDCPFGMKCGEQGWCVNDGEATPEEEASQDEADYIATEPPEGYNETTRKASPHRMVFHGSHWENNNNHGGRRPHYGGNNNNKWTTSKPRWTTSKPRWTTPYVDPGWSEEKVTEEPWYSAKPQGPKNQWTTENPYHNRNPFHNRKCRRKTCDCHDDHDCSAAEYCRDNRCVVSFCHTRRHRPNQDKLCPRGSHCRRITKRVHICVRSRKRCQPYGGKGYHGTCKGNDQICSNGACRLGRCKGNCGGGGWKPPGGWGKHPRPRGGGGYGGGGYRALEVDNDNEDEYYGSGVNSWEGSIEGSGEEGEEEDPEY